MAPGIKQRVGESLERTPVIGVVRTDSRAAAETQARELIEAEIELVEITFSCPGAVEIVAELLAERGLEGPPWIGMGTVTTAERARQALAAGAEFIVTPNVSAETARVATEAGVFFVSGALTPSEIVAEVIIIGPLARLGRDDSAFIFLYLRCCFDDLSNVVQVEIASEIWDTNIEFEKYDAVVSDIAYNTADFLIN